MLWSNIFSHINGTKDFDTKMCEYGIFVAKMGKYDIFVAQICKYGIFCRVPKFCKYALIDSCQGYSAVVDSSASCITCTAFQKGVGVCLFQRLGPIDRTPGIPGSDKNVHTGGFGNFCHSFIGPGKSYGKKENDFFLIHKGTKGLHLWTKSSTA